jgi:hypothetical protein
VSDLERRREENHRLREAKRELARHERQLVRTTRVRTIEVPIGDIAGLFEEIHRRNEDFHYEVTAPDTIRAAVVPTPFPIVVQQLGSAVTLRFEPAGDTATKVTATVPDLGSYIVGNGHLLRVDVVLKFIQEGAERWNAQSG